MTRQHQWLAKRGYTNVETASEQDNAAMTQVNLAHGFTVCGVRVYPRRTQVLYAKALS